VKAETQHLKNKTATVIIRDENYCGVTLFFDGEGAYGKASKIAAIINGEDV